MDERVEALRRAHAVEGSDASAIRLASALERAGAFEEAWALLAAGDSETRRAAFADLARRSPRGTLARLQSLAYPEARRAIERLAASGLGRHPALVALASHAAGDPVLRRHAVKAIAQGLPVEGRELADVTPDQLAGFLSDRDLDRRERWSGLVHRILERVGRDAPPGSPAAGSIAVLLPWLVPLLTSGDPLLAARTLAVVRRATDRDAPPFDPEALARLLDPPAAY